MCVRSTRDVGADAPPPRRRRSAACKTSEERGGPSTKSFSWTKSRRAREEVGSSRGDVCRVNKSPAPPQMIRLRHQRSITAARIRGFGILQTSCSCPNQGTLAGGVRQLSDRRTLAGMCWLGGGGGWHEAMVLLLAAPIDLSPLLILTLCGPERVLVVSTEPPDDLSCLTTPGVGRPRNGLLPVSGGAGSSAEVCLKNNRMALRAERTLRRHDPAPRFPTTPPHPPKRNCTPPGVIRSLQHSDPLWARTCSGCVNGAPG